MTDKSQTYLNLNLSPARGQQHRGAWDPPQGDPPEQLWPAGGAGQVQLGGLPHAGLCADCLLQGQGDVQFPWRRTLLLLPLLILQVWQVHQHHQPQHGGLQHVHPQPGAVPGALPLRGPRWVCVLTCRAAKGIVLYPSQSDNSCRAGLWRATYSVLVSQITPVVQGCEGQHTLS